MLEIICINCPVGCLMTVTPEGEINGQQCPKGDEYAREELTHPTRNITTSIRVYGGTLPTASVKTLHPIPKGRIFDVIREIHRVTADAPIHLGDILLPDAAGTGVGITATRHVPRRAYIFDLDGTLLDSAGVWDEINRAFFTKRGIPFPEDYQNAIAALSFPDIAVFTKERYNLPESPEALMAEFLADSVHAYTHKVALKPGAKEYLHRLKANRHTLSVATAAPRELLTPALKNHGIYDLFDAICTTQDVGHGKTRPDVFLLAARKMNADPAICMVFDDILPAIYSAKEAGMATCGVYDGQSGDIWEQIKQTSDYTLHSFWEASI